MHALKAGGGASKADVDAAIEALKALEVEAGAVGRWLQQALATCGWPSSPAAAPSGGWPYWRRVASAAALHGAPAA